MAARGSGISGLAVFVATVGGFLVYVGIRDVPVLQGLREIIKGKIPTSRPQTPGTIPDYLRPTTTVPSGGGGSSFPGMGGDSWGGRAVSGSAIAAAAMKYLGVPYLWGGHDPATGMDCSGFVTWVLVQDIGLRNLPSNRHTVTGQFMTWTGAQTINRSETQAGDLIVWPGHIGIAVSPTEMIHAPQPGEKIKISRIWWIPTPQVRRVKEIVSSTTSSTARGGGLQNI